MIVCFVGFLGLTTRSASAAKSTCKTIQGGTLRNSYGDTLTTGFDKWGYNYQASLFNGKLCDSYHNAGWCQQFKDVNLMMNWNNAWLSNQSCDGDNQIDRHFGFNSYVGSGAWLTNHASGSYTSKVQYDWNLAGSWNFDVVSTVWPGTYPKVMTISQDLNGNITGTGYNAPSGNTWTVTGNVVGSVVNFTLTYDAPMTGYVATFNGNIQSNGKMNGTWSDVAYGDTGTWANTLGTATKLYKTCTVTDFVKIVAVPTTAVKDATVPGYYNEGMWYTDYTQTTEIGPVLWGDFAVIQEKSNDPCGEYGVIDYMSFLKKGLGNWSY